MKAISEVLHRGKPLAVAKKALILLHGRGGTADDILTLADYFPVSEFYIAAPQAAEHTWYPASFLAEDPLNEPALSLSVEAIQTLLEQTAQHIPMKNIFLLGFSQGACLALEVAARHAIKYGGIAALTGGLIGSQINEKKYRGNFEGTQVFMSNGEHDPHVPLNRSQKSKELMEKLGAQVLLQVYKQKPHSVSQDELNLVKKLFFH